MKSRRALRWGARIALASLLFAQGALALAACDWARRVPALAIAQEAQATTSEDCHREGRNRNLCVAHCLSEDQSLDKPVVSVLSCTLVATGVLHVNSLLHAKQAHLIPPNAVALGPPPRILFQSLKL